MRVDLLAASKQPLEAGTLAIPARLAGDLSQLALGDQSGMLTRQKQDMLLNGRRKLAK